MEIDPSVTTAGNEVANGGSPAAPSTANNNRGLRMHLGGGNGPLINRCNRRRRQRQYSARYFELLEERRNSLQIWEHKEEFLNAFKQNQTVIVVAETGSGKSTQIPQFVLDAFDDTQMRSEYRVACTQPQQVAALKVSRRVAEEMDVKIGEEVGYIVPFGECISENTILDYLTDGMLLREAMIDPLLEGYNVIILDEAHQRTPETDVLFGLLKQLLRKRPDDLKLVVMSGCALEAEKLQGYFAGAPLINVPERLHPVEIFYLPEQQQPNTDYLEAVILNLVQIHMVEPPGDILVFLPGYEEDIEDACRVITWEFGNLGDQVGPVKVVPLYSRLPPAMQQSVFEPAPAPLLEGGPAGRKIVVSTNIAETSLTIDGIVYVVDSGFSKQRIHPLSKASAHQRARRAGRAQPGRCFRLYTEENFQNGLKPLANPGILRSHLESIVLTLRKLGIDNLGHFDFMDPPGLRALKRALEVLKYLGALDDDGNMTKLGEILSEFPLDPQKAKMLVVSPKFNCSNEILSIAAMLSVPNCFVRPMEAQAAADEARARFAHVDGDHLMLLKVYNEYKQYKEDPNWCNENFIDHRVLRYADIVREHLSGIMVRLGLKLCSTDINSPDYYVNIRKAMLAGYIAQVAYFSHHPNGHYVNVIDNQAFQLHPSTSLDRRPEWIIYTDSLLTTGWFKFIRTVTDVRENWLAEVPSRYYDLTKIGHYTARDALERLYTEQAEEGKESKKSEARRVLEMRNKQREKGEQGPVLFVF